MATPDAVVEHRPTICSGCQTPLPDEAPVVVRERRQVQELPPLRLVVTEHQALHVRCPACQTVTAGAFPAEAPSRAQYGPRMRALAVYLVEQQLVPYGRVREVLADLFGADAVVGDDGRVGAAGGNDPGASGSADQGRALQAPVLHSDETGVRQAGSWPGRMWPARIDSPTTRMHPKRGAEATTAIGILPAYTGVSVHDGWKSYHAHTHCRHALCNIHHLRELTSLEEQYHQTWAKELKDLLREMKAATDQARAAGALRLSQQERDRFVARYEQLLAAGHAANPPPAPPSAPQGSAANSRRRATCSNASGWGKMRSSPSSTTSPFLLITTRRKEICGCSKSSKRSPAASAPTRRR